MAANQPARRASINVSRFVDLTNGRVLGLVATMASRGSYERRGNLTSRTVREKAGANKPITRREMRAAFEAWQAGQGDSGQSAHKDSVAGIEKRGRR